MVRIFGRVPKCWATAAPCLRKRAVSSLLMVSFLDAHCFGEWTLLRGACFLTRLIIPFMRHIGLLFDDTTIINFLSFFFNKLL